MVNNLLVHTPKIEKMCCLTTDIYIDYKEIIQIYNRVRQKQITAIEDGDSPF